MQKWGFFSVGILAGIVAVLLTVVVTREHHPAYAASAPLLQATDNTGQGLMVATGGSQTQTNDILWVIHKRKAPPQAGATQDDVTTKDERITLCCYQVSNGARFIKLIGVRDISYDMDVLELNNDRPRVKDIVDELKRMAGRNQKKK